MLPPSRWPDALRWSSPALALQAVLGRRRRARAPAGSPPAGRCPLCECGVRFAANGDNARESPLCQRCGSVPRTRALVLVLQRLGLELARIAVHEASPSLASHRYLRARCASLTASAWLPGVRPGARVGVFRNADLGQQPFADAAFDLVVTQDVLEHVPDPAGALREIHRTLRPGGHHVFTVPRRSDLATRARVVFRDGRPCHLLPEERHADPTTRAGALVVTDFGVDLEAIVADRAAASCNRVEVLDPEHGIAGPVEVFVAGTRP